MTNDVDDLCEFQRQFEEARQHHISARQSLRRMRQIRRQILWTNAVSIAVIALLAYIGWSH